MSYLRRVAGLSLVRDEDFTLKVGEQRTGHPSEKDLTEPTARKTMLLVKKLGGLVFVVMGLLGFASGYYYGSGWLILAGILSLGIGMGLLAIKVIRRNAGR